MPGVTPNLSVAALKRDDCNGHWVSFPARGDSLCASVFSLPRMCSTVSQTLQDMHHSQICFARQLFSQEWHVPICFIVVMTVVLSTISLTCLPEIVYSNDFNARKGSKHLLIVISCTAFAGVQFPSVATVSNQQTHTVKNASVVIIAWGSP